MNNNFDKSRAISFSEIKRYADEILCNDKIVSIIKTHLENPPNNDDDELAYQEKLSNIAYEYVVSNNFWWKRVFNYKISILIAEAVISGRAENTDDDVIKKIFKNDPYIDWS